MTSSRKKPAPHPLLWTVESLQEEPSYLDRAWFGCRAVYLRGLMFLVLCQGDEPWNGLLIPTDHQFNQDIMQDFSGVVQHPVLKKWLCLAEASEDFETVAMDLVEAIRLGDMRIGIEPKPIPSCYFPPCQPYTHFKCLLAILREYFFMPLLFPNGVKTGS